MTDATTFLLVCAGVGAFLVLLFMAGAMRQSSYLSREEENGPYGHLYREGGWHKTTDDPGDGK